MTRTGMLMLLCVLSSAAEKSKDTQPLDRYISEALERNQKATGAGAGGSLWSTSSPMLDVASDLRASRVDDIVTIIVEERADAVASGTTKSARASNATASIGAIGGVTRATGPLRNLATLGSNTQLEGEGATTRQTLLTTTLSARVTHVLPNGNLVVEGTKQIVVNSENQVVSIRGVVRPVDIAGGNVVSSDRLAQLEVLVNGKGVVGDAVRRPFFLYRLLLGILPF